MVNYNNLCLEEIHKLQKEKELLINQMYVMFEQRNDNKKKNIEQNEQHKIKNILLHENVVLKTDIQMLKALVFRLNQHLENQQSNESDKEIMTSVPWGKLNSNALAPLLNSYEHKMLEYVNIVKLFEKEITNISRKMKLVLDENEKLHEMFDQLRKNSNLWICERDRLNSQIAIFR